MNHLHMRRVRHSAVASLPSTPVQTASAPFLRASLGVENLETARGGSGEFEAEISTFNKVVRSPVSFMPDDRILTGAVAQSIEKGFPALCFSHMFEENPPIGVTLAIEERGNVLWSRGKLFVGQNRTADEVFVAMSNVGGDGRPPLREFSISGPIIRWSVVEEDGDEIRDIHELELWEWGPCLRGANTTRLLQVDGSHVKQHIDAGGLLTLSQARELLGHGEIDPNRRQQTPPEKQPAESTPASSPAPEDPGVPPKGSPDPREAPAVPDEQPPAQENIAASLPPSLVLPTPFR